MMSSKETTQRRKVRHGSPLGRKLFEYGTIGTVLLSGVALLALAVSQPVAPGTGVPSAARMVWGQASADVDVPEADFIVAAGSSPIENLTDALGRSRADRLSARISETTLLSYDLAPVFQGEGEVPRVFLASLPEDLHQLDEVAERKALFFRAVLPLVLQVNDELREQRTRLWSLHTRKALGRSLDSVDRVWLAAMADRYGTPRGDVAALLRRVDVIPVSLALAQAIEESGWGRSRFAREGNALFGQWTTNEDAGLVPEDRDPDKTHAVRRFDSLLDAVRSYARNLNTHRAYREFRDHRSDLRRQGKPLVGEALIGTLTRYSERGEDYVVTLRQIIVGNGLDALDNARLSRPAAKPGTAV